MDVIAKRLREVREHLKLNQSEFAALGGVSKPSQVRYEKGERSPDTAYLSAIAKHGVDVTYVLTGYRTDIHRAVEIGKSALAELEQPITLIPIQLHELDARSGIGRFFADDDNGMVAIGFPENWLQKNNITPQNAALIYVAGDSMEPTLPNGAMVMIDRSRTTPDRRKIHVFREGDQLCVKRLERIGKTGVLITSDNPDHSSRILEHPAQSDFEIIGEVVWAGHSKIS